MIENTTIVGNVVTEDRILRNHEIEIRDGRIYSISPSHGSPNDGGSTYVLPGFREQHVHDLRGQMLAASDSDEALHERFRQAMQAFAKQGISGVYLATFGGPLDVLIRYCNAARRWMDDADNGRAGAKLLGVHIEGTFLNVECRGAQPAEFCLIPTRDDCMGALDRLHETGAVKIVNIVPDYGRPSIDAIRYASGLGMLVGSGHTKTTADFLRDAFENADLKFMVHFTNGPTGQSFKPFDGGGAFEGAMSLPIRKELILDLSHVDERYVLDIMRRNEERWGLDKIVAVTDSLLPNSDEIPHEEFSVGTTVAQRDPSGRFLRASAYIQPDGSNRPAPANTLCSSMATMDRAFANLVTILTKDIQGFWFDHKALSIEEAVVKAARLCATNQTILDGFHSDVGAVAVGKRADLTVGRLMEDGGEFSFSIDRLYVDGESIVV